MNITRRTFGKLALGAAAVASIPTIAFARGPRVIRGRTFEGVVDFCDGDRFEGCTFKHASIRGEHATVWFECCTFIGGIRPECHHCHITVNGGLCVPDESWFARDAGYGVDLRLPTFTLSSSTAQTSPL